MTEYRPPQQADPRHHGEQWTGAELEILALSSLSTKDLAAQMGRSVAAVRRMRSAIRTDPRKINLAGVATECSRCGEKTGGSSRFCSKCSPTAVSDTRLPCGTRAASQRHRARGEPLDGQCLAAERAHHAKYTRARSRAKQRLAQEFPDRLRELYREEVQKMRSRGGEPDGE